MQLYKSHFEGQLLFEKCLSSLWLAKKAIFNVMVYLPLLVCGYLLATNMSRIRADALLSIGMTIIIAYVLYGMVYFIKGVMITLKAGGRWLWLPIFMVSVAFTCLLPVWLMYDAVYGFMHAMTAGKYLTWIILLAYALYIYRRYDFLTNMAPQSVYLFYKAGITACKVVLQTRRRIDTGEPNTRYKDIGNKLKKL